MKTIFQYCSQKFGVSIKQSWHWKDFMVLEWRRFDFWLCLWLTQYCRSYGILMNLSSVPICSVILIFLSYSEILNGCFIFIYFKTLPILWGAVQHRYATNRMLRFESWAVFRIRIQLNQDPVNLNLDPEDLKSGSKLFLNIFWKKFKLLHSPNLKLKMM